MSEILDELYDADEMPADAEQRWHAAHADDLRAEWPVSLWARAHDDGRVDRIAVVQRQGQAPRVTWSAARQAPRAAVQKGPPSP